MLGAGSVIAGYRIERVLGAGGMGTVYLAHNPELPRLDALKVLSAEFSRDNEFRARFVREADVASTLDHPNIVTIYDRGETVNGQLWIAMQFIDGTDAENALTAGTMTPQRAVHIVNEVATALDYAHRRRVVHRDVKPANFLLADKGETERVLLADFGIARALDDVALTAAGAVMATLAYAAPEALTGTPSDGRADIYSLGCALFRLLTGRTPFSALNGAAAVVLAHLREPPPRVTEFAPGLPARLDSVIVTAMAKDPAERFQSAREFADAVVAAMGGQASVQAARPLPVSMPAGISYPRTGSETLSWQHEIDRPPTISAPSGPARTESSRWRLRRPRLIALCGVALLVAGGLGVWSIIGMSGVADRAGSAALPVTASPTNPAAPGPARPVSVSEMPGLLMPVRDITVQLGMTDPVVGAISSTTTAGASPLANNECVSAWAPAQDTVYAGSGFTGIAVQLVSDAAPSVSVDQLTQAVATFSDAAGAKQFVAEQVQRWEHCSEQQLAFNLPGKPPAQVTFGSASKSEEGYEAMTHRTDSDPPDRQCERAIAARGNVVIDILACGRLIRVGSELPGIFRVIGERMPHQ